MKPCSWLACEKPAAGKRSMCSMHEKRHQRGTPMDGPNRNRCYTSPLDRLQVAALAYADAETETEYAQATRMLRLAANEYRGVEAA